MSMLTSTRLIALVAFVLMIAPLQAWECNKPHSTVCPCNCTSLIDIPGMGTYSLATIGEMEIDVTACIITPGGLDLAEMLVTRFDVDAATSPYGAMQIRLDGTRTQPTSTYINQVQGQDYPATHNMYAHCMLTFANLPGVVWRSMQPFHMQSTDVNSIFPSNNEDYELVAPVDFEDTANPGVVVATLTSADIIVNN